MLKKLLIMLSIVAVVYFLWSITRRRVCPTHKSMHYKGEAMNTEKATFAGGCFWCVEHAYKAIPGVESVFSGYMGGIGENPTYGDYAQKGHVEVIQITYDPAVTSYEKLLDIFWRSIDPTDAGGQFNDRGPQYRSVIFFHDEVQKQKAAASKEALGASGRFKKPIVTEILAASTFYPAEEYHQDYATKNPVRYNLFSYLSGREAFTKKAWGDTEAPQSVKRDDKACVKSSQDLKKKLTALQYKVTQEKGTEPAFDNAYWDNKMPGIYVDIVSGEPLFSSLDKYDAKTGWPSFTRPLEKANIVEREDKGLLMTRTEVRSRCADSHLGHVFTDGPAPTGLRYCMNSAALRFVPVSDLEKEGYKQYVKLFSTKA